MPHHEDIRFLTEQIITYLGNKRSLLPFIEHGFKEVKKELGQDKLSFLDLFSGTGVVARMAREHAYLIYCNDLERYSFVTNQCYQANRATLDKCLVKDAFAFVADRLKHDFRPGFITELYTPKDEYNIQAGERVFYTRYNGIFLDSLCRILPILPTSVKSYILAPVLAQASVHVNTSGVFKGFYKNKSGIGQFGGDSRNALSRIKRKIRLTLPVLSNYKCRCHVFQTEANELIRRLEPVDLAYFDPPYNQHPYGSNYFMLNLLCNYRRPKEISEVGGIPKQWNRSLYNKASKSEDCLFDAISNVKAKFVLISYNSEGFISKSQFLSNLSSLGKVRVMDKRYNTFRGCRNLKNRDRYVTEHLFLLDKR